MTVPRGARLLQTGEYDRMFAVEDRHWWYQALHRLVLSTLERERASHGRRLSVLDIGCGTGRLAQLVQEAGHRVSGLEPSPRALALAQKRLGRASLKQGLSTRLPFRPGAFDTVLMMDVLYILTPAQVEATLSEVSRVLKPGGQFLFHSATLPWLHGSHDVAVRTFRRYPLGEVRDFLSRSGLVRERLTHRMTLFLPAVALARFLSRVTRRGPTPKGDVTPPSALGQWIGNLVMGLEARLLRRFDLPIGVSLWGVYRKPGSLSEIGDAGGPCRSKTAPVAGTSSARSVRPGARRARPASVSIS